MTAKTTRVVAADVSPELLERLKERSAARGMSVRRFCAEALESACGERSESGPANSSERSTSADVEPASDDIQTLLRELRLVRHTHEWQVMVEDGQFEEELNLVPADDPRE